MSTKIPNGFRLADGTDPDTLKARVRSVIAPAPGPGRPQAARHRNCKNVDGRWLAGAPILPGAAATAYARWADA